jgi:hypothetical protein
MKKNVAISLVVLLSLASSIYAKPLQVATQDDTVKALECITVPIIDGKSDDACWQAAAWQSIDQVWIPWGAKMDPADFSGRYKVTWSSVTDRMYFLVEIVDDVLVKGYEYPMDGYYNYDVVELFFDQDASGGDHTLNQNAFAYHITAGNDDVDFQAMDLTANYAVMNYSDHFDCRIVDAGGVYTWEISMIVYNEDYDPESPVNPTEQLAIGKVSGLSIAYCDNDDPDENPKTRDNFIGSVQVPKAHNNDHYMNADWFGKVKLVPSDYTSGVVEIMPVPSDMTLNQNYPNPFNPATTLYYRISSPEVVKLAIFNTNGQVIRMLVDERQVFGSWFVQWDGLTDAGLPAPSGVYYYQLTAGPNSKTGKMTLLR